VRNPAVVICDERLGAIFDIFGFVVIKSRRPDKSFKGFNRRPGKVSRCLEVIKQHPGHPIDLFIGTLGGKNRGYQELKGCVVIQLGLDVGIKLSQDFANLVRSGFQLHLFVSGPWSVVG